MEIKDCFMCNNAAMYGESYKDVSVYCKSPELEHQKNFKKDGRFCAQYCKGYTLINSKEEG